jgi:hypothetical protein
MLTIHGASDDLIEVDGAISEEFTAVNGLAYVMLSSGQVFRFRFEADGWRASLLADRTTDSLPLPAMTRNEHGDDVVTVPWAVTWVGVSEQPPVTA